MEILDDNGLFPGMTGYSVCFVIGFVILASAPVITSFLKHRKTNAS